MIIPTRTSEEKDLNKARLSGIIFAKTQSDCVRAQLRERFYALNELSVQIYWTNKDKHLPPIEYFRFSYMMLSGEFGTGTTQKALEFYFHFFGGSFTDEWVGDFVEGVGEQLGVYDHGFDRAIANMKQ